MLAAKAGIAMPGTQVDASVTFGRDPVDGLFMLKANVTIHLPGVDRAQAEALVRHSERFCPYAKMARQGIVNSVSLAI